MNILADESVEAPIIARLRQDGHIVVAIAQRSPGITDAAVLSWAVSEGMVLLTADRDFGDMILRDALKAPQAGVVLYRLRQMPLPQKAERIARIFSIQSSDIAGGLTVVERDRTRRRSLT